MKFYVIVSYMKNEERTLSSGYFVEATDITEAQKEARKMYCRDFGFNMDNVSARVLYTCQPINNNSNVLP